MDSTSPDFLQTSLSESSDGSPVPRLSEYRGRQPTRKDKSVEASEDGRVTTHAEMSKGGSLSQEEDAVDNHSATTEEISDSSDTIGWDSGSNTIKLGTTEYAESEHSEPAIDGVPDDAQALIEQWKNDDNELFQRSFHLPNDALSPGVRPSTDELDPLATELSFFGSTSMDEDSPTTPTGAESSSMSRRRSDSRVLSPVPMLDSSESEEEDQDSQHHKNRNFNMDLADCDPGLVYERRQSGPESQAGIQASPTSVREPESPHKLSDNAQLAEDDEESINSDHASFSGDTIPVQSYVDSIFDSGSVGTSALSIYCDTHVSVHEYVDFLVSDPGLEKMFMRSLMPTVLGAERFKRNYSKILQSYARDLKRQSESQSNVESAFITQGLAFISRKSTTMKAANLIASKFMESVPQNQVHPDNAENKWTEGLDLAAEFGHDTSSGDDSPGNEPCHTFMISEMRVYLREGTPFQRMKRNLRNLVIPRGTISRVESSTKRILDLLLGDEYLKFLLFKALSNPLAPLGDDQFDPERAIRDFGTRLKAEASSSDRVRVAVFLETYAKYIGTIAAQRMERINVEAVIQKSQVSLSFFRHAMRRITHSPKLARVQDLSSDGRISFQTRPIISRWN